MKRKILLKTVALLLLVGMLVSIIASCQKNDEYSAETAEDTATTDVEEYPYLNGADLEGATYKILNCNPDMWGALCYVTSHEMNGEEINDMVYKRTVKIEEQLNCKMEETYLDIYELDDALKTDVSSGVCSYAAAYIRSADTLSGILNGTHGQLDTIETLHLDEEYWSAEIINASSLYNRHYIAASDAHLMSFEATGCIFFNVDMLESNHIESPFSMVRNGTWTLDKLIEVSKAVSTLNGDESWEWNENGNSVYGYTTFRSGIARLLYGIDAQYGKKNINDIPYLTCENVAFYDRAQALAAFVADEDAYLYSKGDEAGAFSYLRIFTAGRAAFVGASVLQGSRFKTSDINYGIVPFPKYNKDQTEYRSTGTDNDLAVLTISAGYSQKEDIGLIMDFLSYEADRTFEELYYERRLQYKNNVGNFADNIEMLNLIRKTRTYDPMTITGLSGSLWEQVIYSIARGGSDIVSTVQEYKSYPEKQTARLQAIFQGNNQ